MTYAEDNPAEIYSYRTYLKRQGRVDIKTGIVLEIEFPFNSQPQGRLTISDRRNKISIHPIAVPREMTFSQAPDFRREVINKLKDFLERNQSPDISTVLV